MITNRLGALVLPGVAYDAHADRGESEKRNKELKRDLQSDRPSEEPLYNGFETDRDGLPVAGSVASTTVVAASTTP